LDSNGQNAFDNESPAIQIEAAAIDHLLISLALTVFPLASAALTA
jgi:hypothetical protein